MRITTRTILLIIIVFLLGTNVAVIVTFRNHLKSEHEVEKPKIEVPDQRLGRFFRDQLELDNSQQMKFREFRQIYHRSTNTIILEMQEIREDMVNRLKKKKPNRSKLNDLATKLGDRHIQLKQLTFDYYLNMQSVLNEDQQDKMAEIFQAMLTDEGYAKTPNHQGGPIQGNSENCDETHK